MYGYGFYFHPSYILVIIASIIVMMAQGKVQSAYRQYSKIKNSTHLTGEQVALMISSRYGLNIQVQPISGQLSDHYDPRTNVVRLSEGVYHGTSIAALAVAAHECGHALQHQEGYQFLKLRNGLLPFANIGNQLGWIAIMIGLIGGNTNIAFVGIGLLCFMLAFQCATLPVEFDASRRALNILEDEHMLYGNEITGAKKMLQAAALTYVAGLASSILNLLRIVWIVLGSHRDD